MRSYHFDFKKDHVWIWVLVLPFGIIGWAVPVVLFFGLQTTNSPTWFAPFMSLVFLGIPSYLVGWIFVYSFMEGVFSKVTITDQWVTLRTPWLVFPLIMIKKKLDLEKVQRVNLFAPYGSRFAVFLYYFKGKKERHFYLPKFAHNSEYLQEMAAIQNRVEPPVPVSSPVVENIETTDISESKMKLLQSKRREFSSRPTFVARVIHWLYFFLGFGIVFISGWITSSLPPGGIDAFELGFTSSFLCCAMALAGLFPGIGQIAFWFLGRPVIHALFWFFKVKPDSVVWDTPPSVNHVLAQQNIKPIHSNLTEFLFWTILIFSILISFDTIIGWVRRRAYKQYMKEYHNTLAQSK